MIKAAIFDLDDTLIDEYRFAFSAFEEISISLATEFGLTHSQVFHELIDLYKYSKNQVFNRFYISKNKEISDQQLKKLIDMYRNHIPVAYKLDQFTQSNLNKLKSLEVYLGIITDGYQSTQRNKIKAAQLEELFDQIIVTDEIGRDYWKPHEIAYQKMKAQLGLPFESMVYIGDNISKDFVAPKKLNMMSLYYQRNHPLAVNNDDFENYEIIKTVSSKKELFETLFKWVQS